MTELNLGATTASPASVGGRRRSHKKLRLVKKKTVRRMLAKHGLKMRGGGPVEGMQLNSSAGNSAPIGGRRKSGKTHRRRRHRGMFHF